MSFGHGDIISIRNFGKTRGVDVGGGVVDEEEEEVEVWLSFESDSDTTQGRYLD